MSTLNKAMLIGRLGQDPEVRYTQSNTAVANMNIATNERFKDSSGEWRERTEWHKVVAWGRTAEICQEYLKKGSQIYVEGPIQTNEWEDREGQKRYTTEIKVQIMKMLDTRGEGAPTSRSAPSQGNQAQESQSSQKLGGNVDLNDNFDDIDDDLPF